MTDAADAARLVSYAMRPKVTPRGEPSGEYARLVGRYTVDGAFARVVEDVASGLGLWLVAVDAGVGVVACAEDDSTFAVTLRDYARQTRTEGRMDLRVTHGLVFVAVARLCYPQPNHLEAVDRIARVTVNDVEEYLRRLCARLDERAASDEIDVDPPADQPLLERTWRAYRRRASVARTGDARRNSYTTVGIIGKGLGWLADQGLAQKVSDEDGGTYRALPRFRVLVRELAGGQLYADVLAMAEAADGVGEGERQTAV
jgi:hypothetical protein